MHDDAKKHGVHYTPPELAKFLAVETLSRVDAPTGEVSVLDPACGDGELLCALANSVSAKDRKSLRVVGYERDADELAIAASRLEALGVKSATLHNLDFLESEEFLPCDDARYSLFASNDEPAAQRYDCVIANPPYVRTQVLGSKRAKELAKQFGLRGRVDLYHAFAIAMVRVLKPNGTLGLLTSNRFLTIKSGITLRQFLQEQLNLRVVYDLGDTKLFNAAVLPAIVIGNKQTEQKRMHCSFVRAYEYRNTDENGKSVVEADSVLQTLPDSDVRGVITTPKGRFLIERGHLRPTGSDRTWFLHTPENEKWLGKIADNTACVFSDIANVRVGVKTTADEVFIRENWSELPDERQPEKRHLKPLITHEIARRWTISRKPEKRILYPHRAIKGKRQPIELNEFPGASAYLESHRKRLESRTYVIEAGRKWFEVWVPHNPIDWRKPKIVYPDISERACFFLDRTGAIVNGDCYWITLKEDQPEDWLFLMLGVANSQFIEEYYDTLYHNKLYAGRRRFMTQYVKTFPLPSLQSKPAQEIIGCVKRLATSPTPDIAENLERFVREAFGLAKV